MANDQWDPNGEYPNGPFPNYGVVVNYEDGVVVVTISLEDTSRRLRVKIENSVIFDGPLPDLKEGGADS